MSRGDREVLQASVISLLSLARPYGSEQVEGSHRRTMSLLDDDEQNDEEFSFEDFLMASRYGIWLLVGLFQPTAKDDAREVMGLLSMLFEWYKVTATLPNDKTGAKVEKIKSEHIPDWLAPELEGFAEDDYVVFDCPGQIELYSHAPSFKAFIDHLRRVNLRKMIKQL